MEKNITAIAAGKSEAVLPQPGEDLTEAGKSVGLVERKVMRLFAEGAGLTMESGRQIGPIEVAYETYGRLNPEKDNAILIVHALSGDAHVAGKHQAADRKAGWWDNMVGPGKPLDTDKYYIICSNCLGGCMGTTGPSSTNPKTGKAYGLDFPIITIGDMVELQRHLVDALGVEKLLAVVGGSMGGMQVLDWAIRYPERVAAVLPIATTARLGAQAIAFDAVGRNAIISDENFQNGAYYESEHYPAGGLAVARMVGHITYLSEEAMHTKFGRKLQFAPEYQYELKNEFSVESYLDYQGTAFVDRFDANTYLYFTKAMDYFDLARQFGSIRKALGQTRSRFLVVSYTSDWLFPPRQSKEIVDALLAEGRDVTYCNIDCRFGHDSFLLETRVLGRLIRGFLDQTYQNLRSGGCCLPGATACRCVPEKRARRGNGGSIFSGERVDHYTIAELIRPNSSVLDLGCGNGELLALLGAEKHARGTGITLSQEDVQACTERCLSVVQSDLDEGLGQFGDQSYDYVVLSQTLPMIRRPEQVIREMLRVGREAIVTFPNFAYWEGRLQMFFRGKAPVWGGLPHSWFDKPSINYLSIADFEHFLNEHLQARRARRICLNSKRGKTVKFLPNWFADEAVFVIGR